MKYLLTLLFLFGISGSAHASTDVNVVTSSETYSGILLSTGVITRVDNRVHGTTVSIDSTRIGIEIQNQDSNNIYCAYDTNFSTSTSANGKDIGKNIRPNDVVFIGMLRASQYNCTAIDSATAGSWIHVENVYKE